MKIEDIKEKINEILPKNAGVSKIEVEGPEIAIYTTSPEAFFNNEDFVSTVAHTLKKKINIRTDKTLLEDPSTAKDKIMKLVPEDAQIKDISFNPSFSEVVIEAIKPGLVIGKGGETSKKIISETGWVPNIIRAPTSNSEILRGIRHHLSKNSHERKQILKEIAERIYKDPSENSSEWVRIVALGGFQEVGRSCLLLETPETKIMIDCGVNVAGQKKSAYPMLDILHFPLTELDAVIISHAHMDHSGFLPYLFRVGYRGPVYSTEATRDLMTLLQFDYIDVFSKEQKECPYSEKDVKEMLKYCIPRGYREVTDIAPDIRLTFTNAAHILGSASVHLHIGDGAHNLVYSGDIKYGFVRLFDNIDLNYPRIETLILESTYGGKADIQPNRNFAEQRLVEIINETIEAGGNILIPVFAVGRGQEIMLCLENFYKTKRIDTKCYIDGMTAEASAIHTAYPEYLREQVRRRILQNDSPFSSPIFEVVKSEDRDKLLQSKGNIFLASSGMLTGGPSLEYFKKMAEDPRNTMIFVGYQSEGSLGRKIQKGTSEIPMTVEGGKTRSLKVNMRIETVDGFSGHSDRLQLIEYIKRLRPKPRRLIIDHGNKIKSMSLAQITQGKFGIRTNVPQNLDALRLK